MSRSKNSRRGTRKSRASYGCRNNGSCGYCVGNRTHKHARSDAGAADVERDVAFYHSHMLELQELEDNDYDAELAADRILEQQEMEEIDGGE